MTPKLEAEDLLDAMHESLMAIMQALCDRNIEANEMSRHMQALDIAHVRRKLAGEDDERVDMG